jgi:Polyketide cyclase / dehydrase and lipid transport
MTMVRAYRSAVINSPLETVWATIRDFNALPSWHPAIAKSEIEGGLGSNAVGCVRNFSMKEGGHLREQLLALSDVDHCFTYNILVSPMPVKEYVATFRLTPITVGNRTFAEWWADFNVTSGTEQAMVAQIGDGVFVRGFEALEKKLACST